MHVRSIRRPTPALALAVRAQALPAVALDRAVGAVETRLPVLRDDGERGAQVAEYAMVTGVGAAGVGVLISILRSSIFERFVRAVFTLLSGLIENWWQ